MFRKILLFSIIAFISIYFAACSDDPASLGADLLNQDLVGLDSLDSFKDTLAQSSSTYKFVSPSAASSMLFLGKHTKNGVTNEAYTLLSFAVGFQDSIKNFIMSKKLKVLKATVELDFSYKIGNPNPGFSFTGHKINSGWTAAGFTTDSLSSLNYESGNSIVSPVSFTQSDSVMKFDIDTSLVSYWFTAEADANIPSDNGILLVPTSSNGIFGFHSLSSYYTNNVPFLTVVVMKEGWAREDTLEFVTAFDVSAVKGNVPTTTEYIYAQSSVQLNSLLKFDLSKVPEHAIINYAKLELSVDTLQSSVGSNFTNALLASSISDSTRPDTTIRNTITLNRVGNTFTGNIASFVQNWLSSKINHGILIRTAGMDTGLERFAIKSSTSSDPALRPRLTIIYTNKK